MCDVSYAVVDLGQQLAVGMDGISKGTTTESQLASCFKTII